MSVEATTRSSINRCLAAQRPPSPDSTNEAWRECLRSMLSDPSSSRRCAAAFVPRSLDCLDCGPCSCIFAASCAYSLWLCTLHEPAWDAVQAFAPLLINAAKGSGASRSVRLGAYMPFCCCDLLWHVPRPTFGSFQTDFTPPCCQSTTQVTLHTDRFTTRIPPCCNPMLWRTCRQQCSPIFSGHRSADALLSSRRSERPAVIASLSARVGSIGDNSLGGWYSYRASKTALNQVSAERLDVIHSHPGCDAPHCESPLPLSAAVGE